MRTPSPVPESQPVAPESKARETAVAAAEPLAIPLSLAGDAVPDWRNGRRSSVPTEAERPALRELGQLLRAAREAEGRSLADLGPIVGCAGSLAAIEAGRQRTRASRLRPWLVTLGVAPEPVLAKYAAVIAPERPDGRTVWKPTVPRETPQARRLRLFPPPPLEAHDQAALGAELWRLRARARLDRPTLATAIACSRVFVWLVEHGQREPSPDLVERWIQATGIRREERLVLALRFPRRVAMSPERRPVGSRPQIDPGTHPRPTAGREEQP